MDPRAAIQPSPSINRSGLTYTGKVVIITGGAKGIGEGCARVFVDAGAHVVILDIDKDAGSLLEKELNTKGPGTCFFIEGDASQAQDLKRLIDQTIERHKAIDCLINNAGVHPPIKAISDFTGDEFLELLKINAVGPFLACQLALPHLKETRGNIINMGSLVSVIGQEGATTYAASKGALASFTMTLAMELGPVGVRVNAILPSNIYTASRKEGVARLPGGPLYWERLIDSHQVSGKSGTPEEVGVMCLGVAATFSFSTGQLIKCTAGAELGYGSKTPHFFLDSTKQEKRWDLVDNPEYEGIRSKL